MGNQHWFYQSSKRVNSDITYDNVTTEAPLKSNRVLSYSYKTNGIEKAKTENTYDTHKRVRQKNYTIGENVFTKEFGYSSTRPTSITESSGGTTSYEYDSMGRITSIDNGEEITYEYDDCGQLETEVNNVLDKTIEYVYNGIGNIKSVTTYNHANGEPSETGTTVTFDYDASHPDRLTSYNGKTIGYNSTGCPISYDGKNLDWTRGKLTRISYVDLSAGENSYDYTYNALGQRMEKSYSYTPSLSLSPGEFGEAAVAYTTNSNTKYYYDHSGRLIAEYCIENLSDFTQTSRRLEYLYDESGMIGFSYTASGVNMGAYYFQRNLQGDVIAIYDSIGTKRVQYNYDAYGNCTVARIPNENNYDTTDYALATVNPIRYRGYYWDSDLGMYYLMTRYYDPKTGRFINADTINYLKPNSINGLNLYAYCKNNPTRNIDPLGTAEYVCWDESGKVDPDEWSNRSAGGGADAKDLKDGHMGGTNRYCSSDNTITIFIENKNHSINNFSEFDLSDIDWSALGEKAIFYAEQGAYYTKVIVLGITGLPAFIILVPLMALADKNGITLSTGDVAGATQTVVGVAGNYTDSRFSGRISSGIGDKIMYTMFGDDATGFYDFLE